MASQDLTKSQNTVAGGEEEINELTETSSSSSNDTEDAKEGLLAFIRLEDL